MMIFLLKRNLNDIIFKGKILQKKSCLSTSLSYRDVFVIDQSFQLDIWVKTLSMKVKTSSSPTSSFSSQLKHPNTSNHILASYASFIHNNSDYNFNKLGEFTFNITASQIMNFDKNDNDNDSDSIKNNTLSIGHSVYLWPDNIMINNLNAEDIPIIYKLIIYNSKLTKEYINTIATNNKYEIIEKPNDNMLIISSLSKKFPINKSYEVLQWFYDSLQLDDKNKNKDITYLLTSEMGGHRNATNIMMLPYEDCFQIISKKQVQTIVDKYNNSNNNRI